MKCNEFFKRMYRLCYITRYDTVPRVKDENVAEHSFLVSAIVMKLHDVYDFNLGVALQIAISHDMLENETGDVNHTIKREHNKLYKILKKVEKKALKKYPSSVRHGIKLYDSNTTIEPKIVHLADAIQCKQYAENEIRLGSKYYFKSVVENSIRRIAKIKIEIKGAKK